MSRDVDVNELVTNAAEAELAHMLAGLTREELEAVTAKLALAVYLAHVECLEAHLKVPPTIAAIVARASLDDHAAEQAAKPGMLAVMMAGEAFDSITATDERQVH